MTASELNGTSQRGRRPYWLLLALLLYVAGQCLSAAHWHNSEHASDAECALCLFSSASGDAVVAAGWMGLSIALCAWLSAFYTARVRRTTARFHDSRAPPALLSF
jgi:hypothetical protein